MSFSQPSSGATFSVRDYVDRLLLVYVQGSRRTSRRNMASTMRLGRTLSSSTGRKRQTSTWTSCCSSVR